MAAKKCVPDEKERRLAKIPWIAFKSSKIKLEKKKFFRDMVTAGEEKGRRLEFYKILTKTFPFYLPKRYHAMECLALHESSSNEQYWANASHFWFCCQILGFPFHANLSTELKSSPKPNLDRYKSYFDNEVLTSLLKEDVEECESAAEFLLEPWVLVQLPFQPLLLHQWCVALMAEALKFKTELGDICYFPLQLQSAGKKLLEMWNVMFLTVVKYFSHFQCNVYLGSSFYSLEGLPETLAVLEFVLSPECKKLINALKRMAWERCHKTAFAPVQAEKTDFFYGCYEAQFWGEKLVINTMCVSSPVEGPVDPTNRHFGAEITEDEVQGLKNLVDEKLIKTGVLKAASKEIIFDCLVNKSKHVAVPVYRAYMAEQEMSSEGIQEQECSAMYNLFCLNSDLHLSSCLTSLTFFVVKLSQLNVQGARVTVNTACFEGPHMTLSSISDKLAKVKKGEKKWTYQNILKRLKNSCFSSARELSPPFDQGAEKIAAHFQERIRNQVFRMLEKQFLSRRADVKLVYPEQLALQYLVPCFVASFLKFYKDPSVSRDKKKEFLLFVHNLVESYETKEFCQEVTNSQIHGQKKPFINFSQGRCGVATKTILFQTRVAVFFDELFAGRESFLNRKSSAIFKHDTYAYKGLEIEWLMQLFMLNCRMNKCVDVLLKLSSNRMSLFPFTEYMLTKSAADVDKDLKQLWKYKEESLKELQVSPFTVKAEIVDNRSVSIHQVFGIILFSFVSAFKRDKFVQIVDNAQGPGFPLDEVDAAMWALYKDDKWTLKQQISSMMHISGEEDRTLASLDMARSNLCYLEVLRLTKEGKVKMSRPGEITFFPVKHCRWCGQLETNNFKKCSVCAENPDYPDVHYFCSLKCEKEALDKQHTEEHATSLMIKCGII